MKTISLFVGLLCFSASFVFSQIPTQRLFIPQGTFMSNIDGTIKMASYCMDPLSDVPFVNNDNIRFLGNSLDAMLTFSINGKRQAPISLEEALRLKYIDIQGTMGSVEFNPLKKNIKLISVTSKGFALSDQDYDQQATQKLIDFLKQNNFNGNKFSAYFQIDVWKLMAKNNIEDILKVSRTKILKHHPDWIVKATGNKIKIFEPRDAILKPQRFLEADLSLDIDETSGCVSFDVDSGFTNIKLSSKICGVPVSIEFTSEKTVRISTKIEKVIPLKKDKKNEYSLTFEHSFSISNESKKEDETLCKPTTNYEICWPLKESSLSMELCGFKLSGDIKKITLGF